MTVAEMLQQAQALSIQERKELVKLLVDTFDNQSTTPAVANEHWGKSLNHLLDTLDTRDWESLDIDDPVVWVESLRKQEASRLDD